MKKKEENKTCTLNQNRPLVLIIVQELEGFTRTLGHVSRAKRIFSREQNQGNSEGVVCVAKAEHFTKAHVAVDL